MNQNHRDLRRAAMADFLQSLADLESTFIEPLEDPLPSDSSSPPVPPSQANANLAALPPEAPSPGAQPPPDPLENKDR